MKKNIIVFSNPFGYGPTGVAISVLNILLSKIKHAEIIFAGSDLCMEIIPDFNVKKVHLNERNEEEIEKYLKTVENPYVIGSQNRFCIKVAKRLNIPCAFIDILAWFWKEIPNDHLLADEIFWIKFPFVESKIHAGMRNIHIVQSIISTLSKVHTKLNNLLIHLGGAKYPYDNSIPYSYLNLLSKGLNALGGHFDNVTLVTGNEASNYLKNIVTNEDINFPSLRHDEYMSLLRQSNHLLTVAGVSSTLESFSIGVPVSFLLPLNQSHMALTELLIGQDLNPQYLNWNNYVSVDKNLENMTEKNVISEIEKYASKVDKDPVLSKKFVEDFLSICNSIPDNKKQIDLIKYMGESGAEDIIDILSKKWSL